MSSFRLNPASSSDDARGERTARQATKIRQFLGTTTFTLLALACQPTVTRVNDGTSVQGRPIASKAYSTYLRGRLLEHEGQLKAAEAAYEATLSYDSKASDALIRLGAIRCQSNREASHLAFEQAESIARNAVTLWQERALCALKTGPVELAVQSAKRALSVAPDDPQNSYLLIVAHERAKQHDSARKLAWYVVSRFPRDSYGWELLGSLYSGQYRAAIVAEATVRTLNVDGANRLPTATRRPTILAPILPEDSKPSTLRIQAHTALIAALYSGNDQAVSRAARQLRLTSLKLSIRAFELGAYDVAYLEAARAARIAPDNSDARALTLLLSELLGKTEMLTELLQQAIPSGNHLDPIIAQALEQMAYRHLVHPTP